MSDQFRTIGANPEDFNTVVAGDSPFEQPERIGRYRVEKVLGQGGFGRVFLAYDDQLNRHVAIKVPRGQRFRGTRAHMPPEKARGGGQRADGGSDISSLGIVFYELPAGRRPFAGGSLEELLEITATVEPPPPRHVDDAIPKELERICIK